MSRRVVVTGLGVLAPNGNGVRDFELALRKGLSGIRVHEKMVEFGFGSHVAGVPQGIDELAESYFSDDLLLAMNEKLNALIESEVGEDGTRRTTRYDIDLFKCIYCGFCEEACPVDAIVETRIHEYHMEAPGENIMTKDKLMAVGDKFEAMIAADRAADAPYR